MGRVTPRMSVSQKMLDLVVAVSSGTLFPAARAVREIAFRNKSCSDAEVVVNQSICKKLRTVERDHVGINFLTGVLP